MDKVGGLFHVIRHLPRLLRDDPALYSASSATRLFLRWRSGFPDRHFLDRAISSVVTTVLLLRFHFSFKADSCLLYPFVFTQAGEALLYRLLKTGNPLLFFRRLAQCGGGDQ